jgi:hypothetical protein
MSEIIRIFLYDKIIYHIFIARRNTPMLASGMKALPQKAALAYLRSRHGFATKYPANAKSGRQYEVSAACCG